MVNFKLSTFTDDLSFPFFTHYGTHEQDLYIHTHEDFSELVIVLNGEAEHIVNNESFEIKKGDVFVLSDDTAHGYRNVKDFRICNIMFKPEFFLSRNLDVFRSSGFQALFVLEPHLSKDYHFTQHLRLNSPEFANVYDIVDEMVTNYGSKLEGSQTIVMSDFYRLIVCLSRYYQFEDDNENKQFINLAKAISYIENNYSDDIMIYKLAELCNYSERQFVRIFKSIYDCTPTDYITNLRLKKACKLLKQKVLTITEIAISCGFSNSNYFSRIFRKKKGMSPSEYKHH